jgi:uncharacterized protein (DUF362 family)
MGNIVSLVKVQGQAENLKDSISEALAMIDFNPANPVRSLVIKPNLCYYWNSSTGYTTDPKLVAGIIDYVREKYGDQVNIKIAEADASAMRTKYAFPVLGYERLAVEKKVELVNLSEDELVDTPVSVNGHSFSFKVPQLLLKANLFINVPKLKVMKATTITCAMKNLFGCIGFPKKVKYHPLLDEAIVGMNKILHPHLTLVDGLVALGRHPIRLDLLMAGVDPFSVDWVASELMGYNPSEVRFLKIAMQENVGKKDGITTKGEDPAKIRKIFPKPTISSSKYWWSVQFSLLKIYKKLSGDIVPPVLEE